jgi:hypothetical protein
VLDSLAEDFGFEHAKVLLVDETGRRLFTVASRGYEQSGVGSEVVFGEGLIGTWRAIAGTLRVGQWTATCATARACARRGGEAAARRSAPRCRCPGCPTPRATWPCRCWCAERLVGVLALESRSAATFENWHEAFLGSSPTRSRPGSSGWRRPTTRSRRRGRRPAAAPPRRRKKRSFVFYQNDDCVFVDGEYLIRNVPGRILWKLLKAHREGRTEFTNRELRWIRGWGFRRCATTWRAASSCCASGWSRSARDVRLPRAGAGASPSRSTAISTGRAASA